VTFDEWLRGERSERGGRAPDNNDFAPLSWMPALVTGSGYRPSPTLQVRANGCREIFPVGPPRRGRSRAVYVGDRLALPAPSERRRRPRDSRRGPFGRDASGLARSIDSDGARGGEGFEAAGVTELDFAAVHPVFERIETSGATSCSSGGMFDDRQTRIWLLGKFRFTE